MSYHVYRTDSEGFCIPIRTDKEKEAAIGFFTVFATLLLAKKGERMDKAAREMAEAVRGACDGGFNWHLMMFKTLLYKSGCSFEASCAPDLISLEYSMDFDGRWTDESEEILIHAFSKIAQKGAYVGFEGEDGAMWSYVFDGKGGYSVREPIIDWRGKDPNAAPPAPEGKVPYFFEVDDAGDRSQAPIYMLHVMASSPEQAYRKAVEYLLKDSYAIKEYGTSFKDALDRLDEEEFRVDQMTFVH